MKNWQTLKRAGVLALGLATLPIVDANDYNGFSTNESFRVWSPEIYTNITFVSRIERGISYVQEQAKDPSAYFPAKYGIAKILDLLNDPDAVIPDSTLSELRSKANSLANTLKPSLRERTTRAYPNITNDQTRIPNR